jgi:hypothetical protein
LFFFKQKTAYEICSGDWSSDVCSSDLLVRREQNRIDEDFERGGQNAILVEDVREFELSFLDPLSLEWRDSWDASGSEMNRLPVQVKIRLVVPQTQNERHDEVYTTRAMVPINWALNHAVYNP